jgi:Zn-dependent protease
VQVQLHLFFLLFVAFTIYLAWLDGRRAVDSQPPARPIAAAPEGSAVRGAPVRETKLEKPSPAVAPKAAAKSSATGKAAAKANEPRVAAPSVSIAWVAALSLAVLFGSVLVHELGRRHAAIRVGGSLDHFVLWPLGGLGGVKAPADPRAEVLIHLSGPAANLATAAICLVPLLVAGEADLPGLMNPLLPAGVADGKWAEVTLKLGFWINWVLFLVNLIPAFPFDGGRALRAAMLMHWAELDRRAAAVIVARLATVAAVLMLGVAWLVRNQTSAHAAPPWLALVVLAIFLYFGGKQEVDRRDDDGDDDDHPFGYDFSAGYTSLEKTARPAARRKPGVIAQWRRKRREERQRRQAEIEAADEQRVDEILSRLHTHGKDSLSDDDRAVLARVSARYRGRSGHQA